MPAWVATQVGLGARFGSLTRFDDLGGDRNFAVYAAVERAFERPRIWTDPHRRIVSEAGGVGRPLKPVSWIAYTPL